MLAGRGPLKQSVRHQFATVEATFRMAETTSSGSENWVKWPLFVASKL
jgi:hypothetical protein